MPIYIALLHPVTSESIMQDKIRDSYNIFHAGVVVEQLDSPSQQPGFESHSNLFKKDSENF